MSAADFWAAPLEPDPELDAKYEWLDALGALDVAAGRGPAPSGGASSIVPLCAGSGPDPGADDPALPLAASARRARNRLPAWRLPVDPRGPSPGSRPASGPLGPLSCP